MALIDGELLCLAPHALLDGDEQPDMEQRLRSLEEQPKIIQGDLNSEGAAGALLMIMGSCAGIDVGRPRELGLGSGHGHDNDWGILPDNHRLRDDQSGVHPPAPWTNGRCDL